MDNNTRILNIFSNYYKIIYINKNYNKYNKNLYVAYYKNSLCIELIYNKNSHICLFRDKERTKLIKDYAYNAYLCYYNNKKNRIYINYKSKPGSYNKEITLSDTNNAITKYYLYKNNKICIYNKHFFNTNKIFMYNYYHCKKLYKIYIQYNSAYYILNKKHDYYNPKYRINFNCFNFYILI